MGNIDKEMRDLITEKGLKDAVEVYVAKIAEEAGKVGYIQGMAILNNLNYIKKLLEVNEEYRRQDAV